MALLNLLHNDLDPRMPECEFIDSSYKNDSVHCYKSLSKEVQFDDFIPWELAYTSL